MKIQNYIIHDYNCNVRADFEHSKTHYCTIHENSTDAINALVEYCKKEGIEYELPNEEWIKHFKDMDDHMKYMENLKSEMSESEWKMAFSCDAPNKPGYYRANND